MLATWRSRLWFLPCDGVPVHAMLGERYPWRAVALHALSSAHRATIASARRTLDELPALNWRLGVSGGKDSTALALLCQEHGLQVRAMSVKDDLDYPGEVEYVRALCPDIDVIIPLVSLRGFLRSEQVSLVGPLHSRASALSAQWFYGLLEKHRAEQGYDGVLLGLRQEESHGRRMNRAKRGRVYRREFDGLTVASPIADWSTLDVHAYVWARGWALLPVYLCIDPGIEWDRIRKSWWVAGGPAARRGHYVWLRRWWPALWAQAVEIDPHVAELS